MAKKDIILGKDELIGNIAEQSGETKASVGKVIAAYPQVVVEALIANRPKNDGEISGVVPMPGFGTIATKHVAEQTRKNNLAGGGEYTIPEHDVPAMKFSKGFKAALNADILNQAAKAKQSDDAAAKKAKAV
jgi:nucleoid DNA-binding protein